MFVQAPCVWTDRRYQVAPCASVTLVTMWSGLPQQVGLGARGPTVQKVAVVRAHACRLVAPDVDGEGASDLLPTQMIRLLRYRAHQPIRQRHAETEAGEMTEAPAIFLHPLVEIERQGGHVKGQRFGFESAKRIGLDRALASAAPLSVEKGVVVAEERERRLKEPLLGHRQAARVERFP